MWTVEPRRFVALLHSRAGTPIQFRRRAAALFQADRDCAVDDGSQRFLAAAVLLFDEPLQPAREVGVVHEDAHDDQLARQAGPRVDDPRYFGL